MFISSTCCVIVVNKKIKIIYIYIYKHIAMDVNMCSMVLVYTL